MSENVIGKNEIGDILHKFVESSESRGEREYSRMQRIEETVDLIAHDYDNLTNFPTPRGEDTAFSRNADYAFIEAAAQEALEDDELTPVEARIKQSDMLTLHYLVVGGGIDSLINTYIKNLDENEVQELENDPDKVLELGIELGTNFVIRQRNKANESEITERFPDAPTTGFEYEYIDAIRDLLHDVQRAPKEVAMLEALLHNDVDNLANLVTDINDTKFINRISNSAVQSANELGITFPEFIAHALELRKSRLEAEKHILNAPLDIPTEAQDEEGIRRGLQLGVKDYLEQLRRSIELSEGSEETILRLQKNIDIVDGKLEIQAGDELDTVTVEVMRMLVPSPAERIANLGPMTAIPELLQMEETITEPSASPRMQLREFIYAAKLGAFGERLTVHQNIGGIELGPERTDFMEVNAILEAADYVDPSDQITEPILKLIERGKPVYSDEYPKVSWCSDGNIRYFPLHRIKLAKESKAYPSNKRSILESRGRRTFDQSTQFPTHVRASTFTWLSAWGEQAANVSVDGRNETQQQLAEAWENLMNNWKTVLSEKDIYQPQGTERYQDVLITGDQLQYFGEEKYTLYLLQIKAKRTREGMVGDISGPDTIRSQSRRLIREYNRRVKEIIGY